jgi:hypothetical protein
VVRVPGYRSRGPGFYFWHYQILGEVVVLIWGPLSLVSTIEELLGISSSGSGIEIKITVLGSHHKTPSILMALTSPTSGGCSVGIVS